jgi:hypothetical protein
MKGRRNQTLKQMLRANYLLKKPRLVEIIKKQNYSHHSTGGLLGQLMLIDETPDRVMDSFRTIIIMHILPSAIELLYQRGRKRNAKPSYLRTMFHRNPPCQNSICSVKVFIFGVTIILFRNTCLVVKK